MDSGLDSAATRRRGWKKCGEQRAPARSWAGRRLVPCWDVPVRSRGDGVPASLQCSVPGARHPGLLRYEVFLDTLRPPLFYCSGASGNEGALWGVTRRAPAEGSTSPIGAPGLRAPSPHIAICNVCLLTSLLCIEFKARRDRYITSPDWH